MQGGDLGERDGVPADEQSGLDLRSLFGLLRRRRAAILAVALPLLIPACVLPFLIPKHYEATATIELERRAPVLEIGRDVIAEGGSPVESSIVTLATSDAVLGIVLDRLPGGGPVGRNWRIAAMALVGLADDAPPSADQERQLRLEAMRQSLRVGLAGGKDFLAVTAAGTTGPNAAFLANAVAESYVRYLANQREAASQRAVTWLNQQIYELRDQTARKEQSAARPDRAGPEPPDVRGEAPTGRKVRRSR